MNKTPTITIMQHTLKGAFLHAFQVLHFVFCNSYDYKKTHFVKRAPTSFCILYFVNLSTNREQKWPLVS